MAIMRKIMTRPFTLRDFVYTSFFCAILGALLIFLGFIGMLLFASTMKAGGVSQMLDNTICWFDPVLLQYNLVLLLVAVLIVPLMTIFYIYSMKDEKIRRLGAEIPADKWKHCKEEVQSRVDGIFKIRHYIGSLSALTIPALKTNTGIRSPLRRRLWSRLEFSHAWPFYGGVYRGRRLYEGSCYHPHRIPIRLSRCLHLLHRTFHPQLF